MDIDDNPSLKLIECENCKEKIMAFEFPFKKKKPKKNICKTCVSKIQKQLKRKATGKLEGNAWKRQNKKSWESKIRNTLE